MLLNMYASGSKHRSARAILTYALATIMRLHKEYIDTRRGSKHEEKYNNPDADYGQLPCESSMPKPRRPRLGSEKQIEAKNRDFPAAPPAHRMLSFLGCA